jgi:hypothetical protein
LSTEQNGEISISERIARIKRLAQENWSPLLGSKIVPEPSMKNHRVINDVLAESS